MVPTETPIKMDGSLSSLILSPLQRAVLSNKTGYVTYKHTHTQTQTTNENESSRVELKEEQEKRKTPMK